MQFKGHEVIIRSHNQTEDGTKFDKDATELRVILLNALGDK